jgi:leader peptidase (prepilin peptidase)/N-methyltransferase
MALVWLACLGLVVGSFLNVCIYRLPRRESLLWPGSRCPGCQAPIRWSENVPILGYLALRGRCRACGIRISAQYPLVEGATAAIFLLHYWAFGWDWLLVPRLVFACAMIVLFVIDLQHRILPNVITLSGIVLGFGFSLMFPPGWSASGLGILLGGGVLLAIAEVYYRVRREEGLGMGDVKMLAMIGAFLGWQAVLLTLVLSSFLGSAIGLGIIAARQGDMKYALPYGTFLALAAVVASLVGMPLLRWYVSFY